MLVQVTKLPYYRSSAQVPQLNRISRSSRRQVEYMWNQLLTQIPQINAIITGRWRPLAIISLLADFKFSFSLYFFEFKQLCVIIMSFFVTIND